MIRVTQVLGWAMLAIPLALIMFVVLFARMTRRRRFWCAKTQREVEVQFEERGLPGLGWTEGVKACSVFDPASAVSCHRACRESRFRRQWPPALPVGRLD
ncbi:MAG TPA: hypothetical protein VMS64_09460 [Candidatus Methylomirabilis sp.]|nr:hypothetical protein [Candidatus Methylomirabilis sp.]